jgi:hypothetical protein
VYELENLHGIPGLAYTELLLKTRRWEDADRHCRMNLRYVERWRREEDVTMCHLLLAEIAVHAGTPAESLEHLEKAREFAEAASWQEALCRAEGVEGRAHLTLRDHMGAREAFVRGMETARRCGFQLLAADLNTGLGEVCLENDPEEAARFAARSLQIAEESGYAWGILAALDLHAQAYERQGNDAGVARARTRAAEIESRLIAEGEEAETDETDDPPSPGMER